MAIGEGRLPVESLQAAAFRIPTDGPESDGTLEWDHTTLVVVQVRSGACMGLGYTYAHEAALSVAGGTLAGAIAGRDAMDVEGCWRTMQRAVRNFGRSGVSACAISAVDAALWDLKARALGVPLAALFGRVREDVPVYGSGGFTNYDDARLSEQLEGWVARDGCGRVKIKIGRDPSDDPRRIAVARRAIGSAELFADANGAFSVRQALRLLASCRDADVRWFEEPVTSDDPDGLHRVREAAAATTTDVAAGEYIFTPDDARHLLEKQAVDVLQADVTRCGGYTGFLKVAALCEAHHLEMSGHCAPSLHLPVACAVGPLRHLEWFHDHVRIEQALFDGAPVLEGGRVRAHPSARGHGLELRLADARRYHVGGALS
jgi:L-alanine-DL-glutamate epimerase-like enolase superfamily enzyme